MSDAATILHTSVVPALQLLPPRMDTPAARIQLLAICGQESNLRDRVQVVAGGVAGPARGLAQFELGSQQRGGGVWGVVLHPASRDLLRGLCATRGVAFDARAIWGRLQRDDVLALGLARLLLWTDPRPLPAVGDQAAAWDCYVRNWRPGKPHPDRWPRNYARALAAVMGTLELPA